MIHILSLKGKADKSDWWITTILGGVVAQVALIFAVISRVEESNTSWISFIALLILGFIAIWAMLAVTARRFRDLKYSPWLTLLYLIPVAGEVYILIVCGFLPIHKKTRRRVVVKQVSNNNETQ